METSPALRSARLGGLLWPTVMLILSLTVVLLVVVRGTSGDRTQLAILFAAFLMLLAFPFYTHHKGPVWYEPVVAFALTRLIMELPKLPYYLGGADGPEGTWVDMGALSARNLYSSGSMFLALSLLSVLAYYVGYYLVPTLRAPRLRFRVPTRVRFTSLLMIMYVGSILAGVVFVWSRGGIVQHFMRWSIERPGEASLAGQVYFVLLGSLHASVLVIWLAYRPLIARAVLYWIAVGVSGVLLFVVNSGNRGVVLFFFAVIGLLLLYRGAKLRLIPIAGLVLLLATIFSTLGSLRRQIPVTGRLAPSEIRRLSGNSWLPSNVLDALSGYQMQLRPNVVVANVPDRHPFLLGESYLSIVANPIPRSVWPQKPVFIDSKAGRTFWGVDWATPIGAVAEAYWNFSVGGVLLVFLMYGIFHRWLWGWLSGSPRRPEVIATYFVTLVYLWEPYSADVIKWLRVVIPVWAILVILANPRILKRPVHS